ncbi:MAG: hypothetical protein IAE96_10830 [Chitinophagaceae bacterium]|nr:hypothetical protein [Chitinophagaceae bacterium]
MQFEEFDKKIRDAAEHHYPAYNEQAWGKMHKLLDKHLPEKKDKRRRFILFFLLFFLAGGAGLIVFFRSENPGLQKGEKTGEPGRFVRTAAADVENVTDTSNSIRSYTARGTYPHTETHPVSSAKTKQPDTKDNILQKKLSGTKRKAVLPAQNKGEHLLTYMPNNRKVSAAVKALPDSVRNGSDNTSNQYNPAITAGKEQGKSNLPVLTTEKKDSALLNQTQPALSGLQPAITDSSRSGSKKKKSRKENRFFITLSAGPDASFAAKGNPGRMVIVSGAGVGFTFREKLTIRAGFYNAVKLYSAGPDAYNPPPNFYNYYPYLEKVDARCRVYEIPVGIQYQFANRKKQGWFAGFSLSSYLMKRETYDYYYKTSAWGTVQHREWTLNNQNNHYFSVLGISGGYQYRVSKAVSFTAEPYLRLPLSGVGYGKVRLRSAGVLFSAVISPGSFFHKAP